VANAGKNNLVEMTSTTTIGSKEEPYPMIANVWDFFSQKGIKTIFVSVGSGSSCIPDLDFAESIGCPILKLDTPDVTAKWDEIKEILKVRKVMETTSEFAKPATRKWVLPKNLITEACIPASYNGTIDYNGVTLKTRTWTDLIQEHCARIGLPQQEVRLDIVKIDSSPFTPLILDSLWQSGFRPSLLLINWNESVDANLQLLLSAGHLQMLGYSLIGKEGSRFLYYYTDTNYYETCSWEQPAKRFENPFVSNLAKSIYPGSEGSSIHFPLAK
jgi:hypothetical protein